MSLVSERIEQHQGKRGSSFHHQAILELWSQMYLAPPPGSSGAEPSHTSPRRARTSSAERNKSRKTFEWTAMQASDATKLSRAVRPSL